MSVTETSDLRAFARSRQKPVKKTVRQLNKVAVHYNNTLGWRFRSSSAQDEAVIQEIGKELMLLQADKAALKAELNQVPVAPQYLTTRRGAGRAFAPVLEVMRTYLGFSLRPNQIACALALLRGECVELSTGEGKTLAAGLAAMVAARSGVSTHVITVNDYLANRDFNIIKPMADAIGVTISVLQQNQSDTEKMAAYNSDIVYGTNKVFVFDHLRDLREKRISRRPKIRQMGQVLGIVDELDSVLIDDATVPMILSEPASQVPNSDLRLFTALLEFISNLDADTQISKDPYGSWRLTRSGIAALEDFAQKVQHPIAAYDDLIRLAEQAIQAKLGYRAGIHYLVDDGELKLIDQATGRIMPDRKWAYGQHQMVELVAGVDVSPENRTVGQITLQKFFRQYRVLSGLTGTAKECRGEIWSVYDLLVRPISAHRPSRLEDWGLKVFNTSRAKWDLVAQLAIEQASTRAVLIGVGDVIEAEELRVVFEALGRRVDVLDALHEQQEAEIIGRAGLAGHITVATHLAGRGTDIKIDEKVRDNGGLHVIIASVMASSRLERQLFGRSGRQGDPGSYQRLLSLEDRGLREGAFSVFRYFWTLMLSLRVMPGFALAQIQAERDRNARGMRFRALFREQELVQHLGYH